MKLRYIKPETEIVRVCTDGDVMDFVQASFGDTGSGPKPAGTDTDTGDIYIPSKGHGGFWDDDFDY